jgi:hypothetical protein
MKVKLINVADYEIKEGKVSEVPFKTFVNLCGGVGTMKDGGTEVLPKVRLFKTMGEFINLSTTEMEEIDQNESIRLLQNGQFLVFLKGWNKKEKNTATETNATANTEEN